MLPIPSALLKRSLIVVHRWLGVALSVVFLIWFVSGIMMMYWSSWSFPSDAPEHNDSVAQIARAGRWVIFGTDRRNSAGSPGRRRRDFEKVRIS